jgi:predicted nucleic acid-binding protein
VTTARRATFVDTNVLIYAHAVGDEDPRAPKARDILADLWRTGDGLLSTQVLQEFYAVATRKLKPPLAKSEARGIVATYADWCSVNTDVALIVAASELEEHHSLAFWDALIIEAAQQAGAAVLISEDLQHGRVFGSLTVQNPFLAG